MSGKATAFDPASWQLGSAGFFRFLEDVQPRVRDGKNGFTPYMPDGEIRDAIAQAIDGDYSTVIFCWPRRHGKTMAAVMIALWRFVTRRAENIGIIANSEKQAIDTAFKALQDAFRQTPFLKGLVDHGEVKVNADRIEAPELANVIQAFTASPTALWGRKLTFAQISELHAATSEKALEAIQGSLLDSANSLLCIDSTVGPTSSPLFGLFNTAKNEDSGVYFSHISYKDLDEALALSPAWVDRRKLKNLATTMLPQQFALMHLNRWGDASSGLFSPEVITRCQEERYSLDPQSITSGSPFVVGGGLDRAFGLSRHGDSTVTACLLKVMRDDEEHFYLLASDEVFLSRLGGIRGNFARYAKDFAMSRLGIESYNSQDVRDWATAQPGFGEHTEVIHPGRANKAAVFTAIYAAAAEGRLHIASHFKELLSEMATFEVVYDNTSDGRGQVRESVPKFSHARGAHDDHLHALAWAFHSLREITLNPYELDGVHCYGAGPAVSLCALNGGSVIPFGCAEQCRSMREAMHLHALYMGRKPVNPLSADEFIASRVKNVGVHTLPR